MSTLLKEFPLGVTTATFIYGVLARDYVWLMAFVWSIISVFANKGLKRLSMAAVEKWPETTEILNRPGSKGPGMPSGQAQIAASFVVFLAVWLWYYKREQPISGGYWYLTAIALVGFLAMERAYLDKEQTRLQIVVGAIIGGLFGLVPYYSMLKMPWGSENWLIPETWAEFIWVILIPAAIFLVGNFVHQLFLDNLQSDEDESSLDTEYPESMLNVDQ